MGKTWNVMVDGIGQYVELKNNKQAVVNGAVYNLKEHRKKTGMLQTEYEIPVGYRNALLIIRSMAQPCLVIDNRDCETGEEYVPLKMPAWAWLFIVLHFINFRNGAIGGAMGAMGMIATASVSANRKMNIVVRILIDIGILIGTYAVVIGVATILYLLLY